MREVLFLPDESGILGASQAMEGQKEPMIRIPAVRIRPHRERSIYLRHPWVFSGVVDGVEGEPIAGDLVSVCDSEGRFLAWGHYSPHSQIRIRLVSWNEGDQPDSRAFWEQRIHRACALRSFLSANHQTNAYRLVNAESDGLPGLVVDRYGEVVVIQLLAAGMESRREMLTDILWNHLSPLCLYERSDVDVRQKEGLPMRCGLLRGAELPPRVRVLENELCFWVDVKQGHKTGTYLDQRENRQRVAAWTHALRTESHSADLLNVFSYSGGFAVAALAAGATSVTNIDTSRAALALGRDNLILNGLDVNRVEDIAADAFSALRTMVQRHQEFDVVILDPPKFAATARDVSQATRGYKDINLQALRLLKPSGVLFTFSCSGGITADLFQKIVFGAAVDAGRDIQITGWLQQGGDHPVSLTFPEGAYLKGLVCRAMD